MYVIGVEIIVHYIEDFIIQTLQKHKKDKEEIQQDLD